MLIYQLNSDGMSYSITGKDALDTSIVIPREYNGYPVTEIAEYAFVGSNILDIMFELPSNCTVLGGACFSNTIAIHAILIPKSVQTIGGGCFYGCGLLSTILFEAGSACTSIGLNACTSTGITTLTIPASVSTIGNFIVLYCPNLQSIYFEGPPPSDGNVLSDRTDVHGYITEQYAATWIPYISSGYRNISMMTVSVQLDSTQTQYTVTGVSGEPPVLIIPSTYNNLPVTEIAPNAFSSYAYITAIFVPASIQTIGSGAFSNCTNLRSVHFMGPAPPLTYSQTIAYPQTTYAYYLREYYLSWLPYQQTGYGGLAFPSIHNLHLEIVDTTYCVVLGVFGDLSVLYIPSTYNNIPITEIAPNAFSSYTIPHTVVFDPYSNLTTIGTSAFSPAMIGTVVLPATVQTIGDGAFSSSTLLEAIYFTGPAPSRTPGGAIVSPAPAPAQSQTVVGYYLREYYLSWIPYQQAGYRGLSFNFLFSSQSMFKLISNTNSNRTGSAITAATRASAQPGPSDTVGRKSKNTDMRLLAARRLVCPASCMTGNNNKK